VARSLAQALRAAPEVRAGRIIGMASYSVRLYGDPVLKQAARHVDQIDGNLARLVDDMVETMYDAVGAGLAAPQVGVQKRLFVYDVGDGPEVVINPNIVETSGEWYHDEGCLSIPGLRLGITRPDRVHLVGVDLEGEEVSIEADEFLGRVFQHEVDHLDGVLMVERLDLDQRKVALKVLRDRALGLDTTALEEKLVSADSDQVV
jgi:peptide deformylase